jgi:CRP-like cAMP-binding protein
MQGTARVSIYSLAGKVVSIADLGPGDSLGENPAIDGGPRSASVQAQTACLVASMPASAFREVLISPSAVALDGVEAALHNDTQTDNTRIQIQYSCRERWSSS